jgi:uncharacterized flavoprotein (TIGR03862 family)
VRGSATADMKGFRPMAVRATIIGGGPAGLMATERLLAHGIGVDIFDAMPSLGRKFLMAGKSGLNLTHNEPQHAFRERFGATRERLDNALVEFDAPAIRNWAEALGVETFVGSSGRVFPTSFKAAPLLRAWLHQLRASGAQVHVRHKWLGWSKGGELLFDTPAGQVRHESAATILAVGGGSWPKLGSDGSWVPVLEALGVETAPLRPANCGFDVSWSDHFRERFAGEPVKSVVLSFRARRVEGEFVVTAKGVEGSAIYTMSAPLRDALAAGQEEPLLLDLAPNRSVERLTADLAKPRGKRSMANHMRRVAGLAGVKAGLLREMASNEVFSSPQHTAALIKSLPLRLDATRPLEEVISSAGGVTFEAIDQDYMLRSRPGVFCAGEMLDWEAPTGGYLLSACFATGRAAGEAAAQWLKNA